jgi:leader peptidase (prepilin peptidase) / N-methyltransferase
MVMNEHLFLGAWFLLFGAAVGSFLNVVILRLPLEESLVRPPSKCPRCGHPIRVRDNIPVFSYLLLAGRCRDCGSSISFRYPLIEATTGALAVGIYAKFGLSPLSLVFFAFCAALWAVFWIDLDHMIIPDVISLNGIGVGLLAATLDLIPGVMWSMSLSGIALGALILYLPAVVYERLRGVEGLGRGDVKLLAMIGAFTGPPGVIFVLFFSSVAGCIAVLLGMALKRTVSSAPIPFGPFLSGAAILFVFAGSDIIDFVFGLSHIFWSTLHLVKALIDLPCLT